MEKLGFTDLMTRIEASHEGHIDELGEIVDLALAKTIKRVISSQKKGVLSINLTFNTVGENRMAIDANVVTKLPEPKADSSFLYHDLKGNLVDQDPAQPPLFDNVKPLKMATAEQI